MPEIRRLPTSVVNKIAAGEVIERPASVVKELLENALDAGATRIDVTIEQGGGELIRIADNGCGMTAEQLPMAVTSHATSKIGDADDLFAVHTLGFRGEALASIAEISRMLVRSRSGDSDAGAELEIVGGQHQQVVPCGCPVGTVMEVRSLFFNTPVRRKYLRTTQTEMGHCSEAVTRLALAHPHVHFTLRHQNRLLHDLPPCADVRVRVARFFGDEIAEGLIWVENEFEGVRLAGYVANPMHSRSHNRMQYLFLNGRYIRDRALQHALGEAYRGLLLTGRYPISFLRLDMPADLVDVNVHPTKLEVRFADSGRVYSQLLGTLRTRFLSADLTAQGQSPRTQPSAEQRAEQSADHGAGDEQETRRLRQELVDWAKGAVSEQRSGTGERPAEEGQQHRSRTTAVTAPSFARRTPLELNRIDPPTPASGRASLSGNPLTPSDFQPPPPSTAAISPGDASTGDAAAEDPGGPGNTAPGLPGTPQPASMGQRRLAAAVAALQVHNRYLVSETDEGLIVIDQHALHERILYEHLRQKVLDESVETQRLLIPEPIDLTSEEVAAALDHQELLLQLGLVIEPFGGDTVLVTAYPAMLANFRPAEVLQELLAGLVEGKSRPERRDLLDELLHMMACKAAIKAGDRLTPEEITSLLEQRHLARDAHHCPHGRPTALVFTRAELDRQFKRQ